MGKLEEKVIKKFNERVLTSFLDVVVLNHIEKQPLSGYALMGHIFKSYGILLSAGTVYATMYALERDGLVTSFPDGRRKVYKLTEKGKINLEIVRHSPEIKIFMMNLIHDKIQALAIS